MTCIRSAVSLACSSDYLTNRSRRIRRNAQAPQVPQGHRPALAAVVVTVIAAAGSPASAAKSAEPVTLRLGYFPNVTHASALVGTEGGIFAKQLGSGVDLKLATFNSGTEELAAIPGRGARRRLHRAEPHHHRVDAARQEREGDLRCGFRRCVLRRQARHHDRRRPQGQDPRDAAARQHPGRRPAQLAQEQGLTTDTSGGGDVKIVPQDNATSLTRSRPATSRVRGYPSRGRRGSSTKAAARSSSTRPRCGRRAST